jgi:hypothetical protein
MDASTLREALIDELIALNQYEEYIDSVEEKEAKDSLRNIYNQKKRQVVELFQAMQRSEPGL